LPYVRMQHVQHGELFNYVFATGAFSEVSARVMVRQLVDGLLHLREQGKSHLDLKPENILVAKDWILQISD